MPLIIAIILALILIIILRVHLRKIKCPDCKKRKVTEISSEVLRTEEIFFKEKETIKEYKNTHNFRTDVGMKLSTDPYLNPPEKITTREVTVPGKRVWYKVGYKCDNCGKTFYRQEYVDKKTTVVK